MNPPQILKYLYDFLNGLKIGDVFQDKKPYDDTTKQKKDRTYLVYTFPNGIDDMGPFYQGVCVVQLGCRDRAHFVADMPTLIRATDKLYEALGDDHLDKEAGINMIDFNQDDFYSDNMGNHEFLFSFHVFAEKRQSDSKSEN